MHDDDAALVRATVKILPIYTCEHCGARQTGDTLTIETGEISAACFSSLIARQQLPAHAIPVHWAAYGQGHYRCQACAK